MLQNKRFLCVILLISAVFWGLFSQTSSYELAERQLTKAEAAFDDGKLVDAYKSITAAMKISKTSEYDVVPANVLVLARTIYRQRLLEIQRKYDEPSFIEIRTNLETFPEVSTSEITKLVRQIEAQVIQEEKAETKKDQREFLDNIRESTDATSSAVKEMSEQTKQTTQRLLETTEIMRETSEKSDKKFTMIFIIVLGVAVVILLVVFLIIALVRAFAKHSVVQQAQYAEAFKLLAQNQSQTNRLMIGGIAGLYGDDGLKLAGSSSWTQDALPEPEETPEEKGELRELAAKCEDLGAKIDQITGRKNNSKNVSELVYKLATRLGIRQHEAMVYFCASMVYDAGFLSVNPELLKAENITDEQRGELNRHVDLAEQHLQFVPKRYWNVFEAAAHLHHENMDGSGSPDGLKGDAIPKVARIIRVADSFNALSSRRSYRGGTDKESAVAKLEEQPNIYDPDVINALKDII